MKIDAKLKDAVPDPEKSQIEACLRLAKAEGDELLALLKAIARSPWERDRIEPKLWVPVLDHFDALLTVFVQQQPSASSSSTSGEATVPVSVELVVEVLRVSEIMLFQSEKLRRVYASLEQVSTLLESEDLKVVQAALHLLRLVLKRGRSAGSELHRRLAQLAAGWSPFEPRLTLLQVCTQPPSNMAELTFEYRAGTTPRGSHRMESVQVSKTTLLNTPLKELMQKVVQEEQLPEAGRGELLNRLRMVRAMSTVEGRQSLVIIRILAMSVMLQTAVSFQKYLSAYPGLLSELVEMLRQLPDLSASIVEAVCAATGALVRERSQHQRQLSQLLQLSAPHGLVGSLLRATLAPRTGGTMPHMPPVAVEAVLELFLSCVGVTNVGALGHAGIIACLLDSTGREGQEWLPSVCLAYRVIEAVIDVINGAAATLFRDLNGQEVLAQRLSVALEAIASHSAVPEDEATAGASNEALIRCWEARRTLTALRGRVGSILRCILAGLRAEATRGPGVLRGPLTPLVRNLLAQPQSVGAAAFAGASSILAHLIGDDPSCVGALIEAGVIPAFLDAVSTTPNLLRASEVFQITVTVLGAVHLHDAGEREVRERSAPHLFQVMVSLLVDPVAFRTLGSSAELHSALGGALDEVASNRPSMRQTVLGFAIKALDELLERARAYPAWMPKVDPSVDGKATDATEQYADRLAAIARFLEALLAQAETAGPFAQMGGAARLVEALNMPCLPPHFLQAAPGHPMAVVFRAIVPNATRDTPATLAGLAEKLADLKALGPLPAEPIGQLQLDRGTAIVRRVAAVATVLAVHSASHRDIVSPSGLLAAASAVQELSPTIQWLFRQCAFIGSPPTDHYSENSVFRDPTTDFSALARDAYKDAIAKAREQGNLVEAAGAEPVYPAPVIADMVWRAYFAFRHFLVGVVAKQLSLPTRRPNRLYVPPPARAAAARQAASVLASLTKDLLELNAWEELPPGQQVESKMRYAAEVLDLVYRVHIDEKHHHVRILCVDYLSRLGVFAAQTDSPFEVISGAVLDTIRTTAGSQEPHAVKARELAVQCFQALTQYMEKLTSFKWIRSAPAPPTALQPSEREGGEGGPGQAPPSLAAAGIPPPVRAASPPADTPPPTAAAAGAGGGARVVVDSGDAPMPQAPTSQQPPSEPQPPGTAAAESDAIDPWALWATMAMSGTRSLLPFWKETNEPVIRCFPAKAMQGLLRAFFNTFDNADGRSLVEAGPAASSSQPGPPGSQQVSTNNERAVQALVDMGFSRRRVEVALWNTGSTSVEYAMEWLVNHPEIDGESGRGPEGDAGAGGAAPMDVDSSGKPKTEGPPQAAGRSTSAKSWSGVQAELRQALARQVTVIGANIADGTPLVELISHMVHLPGKLAAEPDAAADTAPKANSKEVAGTTAMANWRMIFSTMMRDLNEVIGRYPPEHGVWASPPDASEQDVAIVHGRAAFTLGVLATLLHQRATMLATMEGLNPTCLNEAVDTTLQLLQRVASGRERNMPNTWSEAFSQGYTFLYGNLALPSPDKEQLAASTSPPRWFDAAFVVLHEAVQQMWLTPPLEIAKLEPGPPVLSAETQEAMVTVVLDTITMFPKADGNVVMACLLLLRELCSTALNAAKFAAYPRAGLSLAKSGRVVASEGGGMLALLRLPRHARCPGLLRLVSDICGQLLEDDAYRAQQLEDNIQKLCEGGKSIELSALVEKMRPWIRSSPKLFEEVLKNTCCVKPRKEPSAEGDRSEKVEVVLAPEGMRKQQRPQSARSELVAVHLKVLQRLLDHLLWAITMESLYEKHGTSTSTGSAAQAQSSTAMEVQEGGEATASAPAAVPDAVQSGQAENQPATSSSAPGSAASKEKDKEREKEGSGSKKAHPLALPADSVLFVLQNALVCYPCCAAVLCSNAMSQGTSTGSSSSAAAPHVDEGHWTVLPDQPSELPPHGVHMTGKSIPLCAASKTPLAFMLRRILASGFFAGDPSSATMSTLGKVAGVLGAVASKHQEARSKVLHEAVSLLKQLANHVEASSGAPTGAAGSPAAPAGSRGGTAAARPDERPGSGRRSTAPRSGRRTTASNT